MHSIKSVSVRSKLILLIAIFVASLSAILGWSVYLDYQSARQKAFADVEYVAEMTASNIELAIRDRQRQLELLANRPLIRSLDPRRCDPFVLEFVRTQPGYATFTTRDMDDNHVCSLTKRPLTPDQMRGFDWYQKARRSERPLVGNAFDRLATPRWAIALSYPIMNDEGKLHGVAILPINLLKLNEQLRRPLPKNVVVTVTDAEDRIILRSADLNKRIGRIIPAGFSEKSQGKSSALFKEKGLSMQERLWGYVEVPNIGWRVYAGVPEAQVLAPIQETLYHNLLLGALLLALLLLLSWWIGASVVNPIASLAAASKSIAEGGLATSVAVTGLPEIRSVATEFNRMLERCRRDEADLRESETRFRMLTELSADWYWEQDGEFRYVKLETLGAHLLMPDANFWLGKTRWEGTALNMAEADWEEHRQLLRSHQPYRDLRFQFDYGDGHVHWIATSGAPIFDQNGNFSGYRGVGRDLTQQYAAEELLRLLEASVSQLNDIVIITQATPVGLPGPKIVFVNPAFERITGYSAAEVIGKSPRLLQGPKTDLVELDRIRAALEQSKPVRAELLNYKKNGEPYWLELDIAPIADASGSLTHWVAVERDITERRAMAEQLHQSQSLKSLGQLTGGIAHDFNNLLTVILGNAEVLQGVLIQETAHHALADMIADAAQRGADLTNRLLAFARKQPLEPEPLDVNRLISSFDPLLRRTLGEHVEIAFVSGDKLWNALADASQLESALLNLCINSRDAMPGGGRLTIETDNIRLDEAYASRYADLQPGDYVMLAVSDTGHGIEPQVIAQVFDPFFTTKEKGKGSGLGLAMVYGFAKQSNGHVNVYSEPGHGTTIRLYLPRSIQAADQLTKASGQSPLCGGREAILLVEDDEMVRTYASGQLAALGYQVMEAPDGNHALDIVRSGVAIDLLFTDVVMPGMGGRQLVDQARLLRPGLKVLYTSGYTENAIVHHGRLDQGVYLLSKPYRRAVLAIKVREALDSSL